MPVALRRDVPGWMDSNRAGFDAEALWKRVEGDPELLRELIGTFEIEFPGMLASVEGAIEHDDSVRLERAAHKIKGTMVQFSAGSAAAAARELEQLGRSGTLTGAGDALEKLRREILALVERLHVMSRGIQE